MITRIVRMQFREEAEADFLSVFRNAEPHIRSFPGCLSLEIYKEKHVPSTFFTLSTWESEENLEQYRNSALFSATWSATKKLFSGPPSAWTLEKQ
ncbi:MAG: putative quinol monooxygenase [Bacteroidota bacterium]